MNQPKQNPSSESEQDLPLRRCFFCDQPGNVLMVSFHHHAGEKWLHVGCATDLINQVEKALRNPRKR